MFPPRTPPLDAPATPPERAKPKVTARMLVLRELIAQGDYPDRDVLAERIVDARFR